MASKRPSDLPLLLLAEGAGSKVHFFLFRLISRCFRFGTSISWGPRPVCVRCGVAIRGLTRPASSFYPKHKSRRRRRRRRRQHQRGGRNLVKLSFPLEAEEGEEHARQVIQCNDLRPPIVPRGRPATGGWWLRRWRLLVCTSGGKVLQQFTNLMSC